MSLSINLDQEAKANMTQKLNNSGSSKLKTTSPLRLAKDKKPKSKKKFIVAILILLIISTVGWLGAKEVASRNGLELSFLDALNIINPLADDPKLDTDESGIYTNVLLVGIDTREDNKGLQNTDSLMVASFNHETQDVILISIPRDFYAEIPNEGWYVKINSLYNRAEQAEEGNGLESLSETIGNIVGMDIQYYIMVDLQGFKEVIDIVGGIDVNVENSFTDYQYPSELYTGPAYITVAFNAGPQTMDGETALQYARSRKSLDNGEGSDYARARRQQIVIQGIKNKILSSETLLSPNKMIDLSQSLTGNIESSEYTLEELEAGTNLAKNLSDGNVYSIVLDPSLAGSTLLTTGLIENSYSLGPVAGLGKYDDLHTYLDGYLKNPKLYEESAVVYVYDVGLGYYQASQQAEILQVENPELAIIYGGTLFSDEYGTTMYQNSEDTILDESFAYISEHSGLSVSEKPDYIYNGLNGEDIVILLGAQGQGLTVN